MNLNLVLAAASLLLFLGLVGFFAYLVFHQQGLEPPEPTGAELIQQHYAPGETLEQPTPYWVAPVPAAPDPLEISANLDRKIVLGAGMLFGVFALIGGYFVAQPNIRAAAVEHQQEKAVERGRNLYANFCFDCHGKEGKGDVGVGLPLNKPDFKYENIKGDPVKLKATQDLIQRTIERGRPKPLPQISMPAWGQADGGSLNDEQINQLVTFIMYGRDEDWADVVTVRLHTEGPEDGHLPLEPNPPKPVVLSPLELGRTLTQNNPQTPCVTCHSFEAGKPSTVPQAPNLSHYGTEGPINAENKARKAAGDADWLFHWVSNAPSIKPDIVMPPFNKSAGGQLDDTQIRAIVEYLTSLK